MSNILVILAHPKEDSFGMALAQAFMEEKKAQGDSVEFIDLYRSKVQQPFFVYDDPNNFTASKEMLYFQEKITVADEIAIFHPNWWGGFPAILQNWIDWNFSKGFAFTYGDKGRPQGLLEGKKAQLFVTTGAPGIFNFITGIKSRMAKRWQKQIIGFCGMSMNFTMYGSVGTSGQKSNDILNDVKAKARN